MEPGQTYKIRPGVVDPVQGVVKSGALFRLEGNWLDKAGKSWLTCDGDLYCAHYAMRCGYNDLPLDDEVLYGYIDNTLHLVHKSELQELGT